MFVREFKTDEEKDEFLRFAIEKYIGPLEKLIEENFTSDTVIVVSHDGAIIRDFESYKTITEKD